MRIIKYFFSLLIFLFVFGCSSTSVLNKNNGYSINNYSDKIQYIELRDGRKIEFSIFTKLSYELKEENLIVYEKEEIKEEIAYSNIRNFQYIEETNTGNPFVIGSLIGLAGCLIIVAFLLLR